MRKGKIEFIGLGPRFIAVLIDVALFVFFIDCIKQLITYGVETNSLLLFFFYLSIPFVFFFYNVCFHAIWGQTLGKMVMKIKLYTTQFRDIDLKHAILRDSIALSIQLFTVFGILLALQELPSHYMSMDLFSWPAEYVGKIFEAAQAMNPFGFALKVMYFLFAVVIFFSVLANRYRRSINDKLAGTVLVRLNM